MAVTHTSAIQEQRFWTQSEKFNGLNGNFLAYMSEVRKEMLHHLANKGEKTRQYKVIERACKYITLIYNYNIGSDTQLRECKAIIKLREVIKYVPLPKVQKETTRKYTITRTRAATETTAESTYTEELTSDVEMDPPEEAKGWPKGWCDNTQEREVSEYIKNVIESSVTGAALEVVKNMGMPRDRTGFDTVERLAKVYGRDAGMINCLPANFVWGCGSLVSDWTSYKHQLDSTEYVRVHPTNEPMMVQCALQGFDQYNNSYRVLDHVRTNAGENPKWEKFKEVVDKFIGDTYRSQFCTAMYQNHNGLQAMTAAGVLEKIPDNPTEYDEYMINYVANQFQGKKAKAKGKGFNKKPESKPTKAQFDSQASNRTKQKCAWCNDKSHLTYQCKTYGNGKFKDKKCNRCGGIGHPQGACINPPKEIVKKFETVV